MPWGGYLVWIHHLVGIQHTAHHVRHLAHHLQILLMHVPIEGGEPWVGVGHHALHHCEVCLIVRTGKTENKVEACLCDSRNVLKNL